MRANKLVKTIILVLECSLENLLMKLDSGMAQRSEDKLRLRRWNLQVTILFSNRPYDFNVRPFLKKFLEQRNRLYFLSSGLTHKSWKQVTNKNSFPLYPEKNIVASTAISFEWQ